MMTSNRLWFLWVALAVICIGLLMGADDSTQELDRGAHEYQQYQQRLQKAYKKCHGTHEQKLACAIDKGA